MNPANGVKLAPLGTSRMPRPTFGKGDASQRRHAMLIIMVAVGIILALQLMHAPENATPETLRASAIVEQTRKPYRSDVRLPLSRCFGAAGVEELWSPLLDEEWSATLDRELEVASIPVNVTEYVNMSAEGEWLHAGIRSNPFAPFATCEPPTNDGLRPGYGLLLHGVQLLVSGRRDVTDLARARVVDAEKEFRMGIVIRVPVSMARRMRDESVLKHLLKRVAYGIAVCNADPSRLLHKGLEVPTAVWAFELLPQCVLYDDGRYGQEVSDSLDPPWVGEDGTFINNPAPALLSRDTTHPIPPRRIRRFLQIGGRRIDSPYHGLFQPHGIAMLAWVVDRGLQSVRHYAPYLVNVDLEVTTLNVPRDGYPPAGARKFDAAMYRATFHNGGGANVPSSNKEDGAAFVGARWVVSADYGFVATWDECGQWLSAKPLCHRIARKWANIVRPALFKLHTDAIVMTTIEQDALSPHRQTGNGVDMLVTHRNDSFHDVRAVPFDWQRGAVVLQNGSLALSDARRSTRITDSGLPWPPRAFCTSVANEASIVTPLATEALTVLYDWRVRREYHQALRGVHPDDERSITLAFNASRIGLVRRVRFGPRWDFKQQLSTIWRYPVLLFVQGGFINWMLVARPNTTFVMYYESNSGSYARENLPYVYPLLMFAYHTLFRSQHVRLIVFVREVDRTASVEDLVAAVREPFEPAFVLLRPGRNRTVLRAQSYPHQPATRLFERGFPLR